MTGSLLAPNGCVIHSFTLLQNQEMLRHRKEQKKNKARKA